MSVLHSIEALRARVGTELGTSGWIEVKQSMMDQFACATLDPDRLHTDPEWAVRETPYGGTIAFGFWTLSMLTCFSHQVGMWPMDAAYALNYGLNRVRWIHPVKIGAKIRMRSTLAEMTERTDGSVLIRTTNVIEIEGVTRPALSAEWLGLFMLDTFASPDAA